MTQSTWAVLVLGLLLLANVICFMVLLNKIAGVIQTLKEGNTLMAGEIEALTVQVTANTDAEQSAVILLNNLSGMIASLKNDPVALMALATQLKQSGDTLAAAIVANTPAA